MNFDDVLAVFYPHSFPPFPVSSESVMADSEHEWMRDLAIMRLRRELIEQRCRGRASDEALEMAVRTVSHHVRQLEQELMSDLANHSCYEHDSLRSGWLC